MFEYILIHFKMLSFLITLSISEEYPLIVGIKPDIKVPNPQSLVPSGALGRNHALFIIDKYNDKQITTPGGLGKFGGAYKFCEEVGKLMVYNKINSDEFNYLDHVKSLYQHKMTLDPLNECTCKAENFKSGLIIIHVSDDEPQVVEEVLNLLPNDTTVAFLASTEKLFKM